MDNFNNENLQEVDTNDVQILRDLASDLNQKSKSMVVKAIRAEFRIDGELIEGVYVSDDANYVVVDVPVIKKLYKQGDEIKRCQSIINGLQAQIISNGKALSDMNRVSSKQEAVKKYGDEIIADYLKEHKAKIIEQLRPEIESAVIRDYLATHKRPVYLENANKKRSENCAGRTAAYLADLYNGMGTLEIAEKHGAVRGTIQRLLRINDSSDIDRLMEAYSANSELFGDATEEEIRNFLEARWNKKSESLERRLAAAREFIAKNTPDADDWGM